MTDPDAARNGGGGLLPTHLDDLARSGLTPAHAATAGVYSEGDPAAVSKLLNWSQPAAVLGPALVFPYLDPAGRPTGYVRLKPTSPRADPGAAGKRIKYEAPRGQPNRAYLPPGTRTVATDPAAPLLVTEGEKKALAADAAGFPCLGLPGVWAWQAKRTRDATGRGAGPRELIPDLAGLPWAGRRVWLAFDSDSATNPSVRAAERALAAALTARGAVVAVVRLPAAAAGGKQGVDDFLVARGPDALRELLAAGRPAAAAPAGWGPPVPFGRDVDPPDFPPDVLPPWLRDMAAAVATATQTPSAAAGMLALAAVAGGLAAAVRYRVRPGFGKNANLYVVVAMLPAERKSAVFKAVFAPVFAAERAAVERAAPLIAEKLAEKGVLEARLKRKQTEAAREDDPGLRFSLTTEAKELAGEVERFAVPVPPVYVVDDDTVQMLARTLVEQGGRLMQAAAEGTAFEIAGGRYSDAEDFDVYLKAHDGDPLRVGRVGRGRTGHDDPRLTCALAVQPDVLAGLGRSAKAAGRGFLARWLYAVPAPMAGRRLIRPAPVPAAVAARYEQVMAQIWSLPAPADGPSVVEFSREADDALAAFEARVEPQLADGGPLAGLASWGGKLAGEVARLAGTLHLAAAADRPGGVAAAGPVSAEAVAAAVRLADEFLVPHARLAFGVMHADPVEELARRVLAWLARRPELARVTRRDLHQGLKGGGSDLKADDLVPAFALLADHNNLRPADSVGGPGRPAEVWEVNPLWARTGPPAPPNPPAEGRHADGPGAGVRDSGEPTPDGGAAEVEAAGDSGGVSAGVRYGNDDREDAP